MLSELFLHLNMDSPKEEKFSYAQFKENLIENKKMVLLLSVIVLVAALLFGNISLINGGRVTKALQVGSFLALGYLHVAILQKKLPAITSISQTLYTLSLSFIICLSLGFLFMFRGYHWLLMIAASTLSFLLPYLITKAWTLYNILSVSQHGVWQYIEAGISKQSVVSFNNIPIRIKFFSRQSAQTETVVSFNAPIRMKLGTVFYHIIQQQNEGRGRKIEYVDEGGAPFYWEFYSQSLGGLSKQFLNPEESLVENNIQPNTLIIAQRVTDLLLLREPDFSNEPINS